MLDDDDAADPGPYPCMYAIYALITRRVTGQSFVCRMVYIGMVFSWAPSVLVTLHRWLFAVLVTLHRWQIAVLVTLHRWMH